MDDRRLGRAVRARRHRLGWRQVDLAAAARVSAGVCGLLERGQVSRLTVSTARAIAAAVDLPLGWDIGWQRIEIDRLFDADHAALCAAIADLLIADGWDVRSEVSFNHFGDRGRIDLLAWHPTARILLVIEVKTTFVDAQETIGGLDVKARVARHVVADLGWPPPHPWCPRSSSPRAGPRADISRELRPCSEGWTAAAPTLEPGFGRRPPA